MTVREIIGKVDEIDHVIETIKCSLADLDVLLVCDILEEYRDVLLNKTVK